MIPYGKQSIGDDDIQAVVDTLRSDFITTGPKVAEFEKAVCEFTGAKFAVAVSNGTAALHCAAHAAGIGPGDEVIVTPMTFAASANCILYCGGTPVFADVLPGNLLINPEEVEKKITERTKAIIAVDYAGQPCDYGILNKMAKKYNLVLISDACHSIGAEYKNRRTGTLAGMTCFSFHPVKHITTGEGGMITTDNSDFAEKMRVFRNHGITTDYRQREKSGAWFYEMTDLGFNYRITDFQCALGISQLKKLTEWISKRRKIAEKYDEAFKNLNNISILSVQKYVLHAYHLYVLRISQKIGRDNIFKTLRNAGIGVNVHYIPVHMHPYYRDKLRYKPGICPVAENAYKEIISIPMFSGLQENNLQEVISKIRDAVKQ